MKKYVVFALLITLFALTLTAESLAFVKVSGNKNIPTAFIMSKLSDIKAGQTIDRDTLYKALKGLYDTGFFSYVEPKIEPSPAGMGLVVNVTENPVVKKLTLKIDGPDLIGNDKIRKAIAIKTGEVLNLNDLKATFQSIVKQYTDKGYLPNVVGVQTNIVQKTNSIEIPNGELVVTVKEYAIWTIEITGEHGKLTSQQLVKNTGIFTLKDFESLNSLIKFFVDYKQAYPKFDEVQAFQAKLSEMGYFSPQTSLSFAPATATGTDFKHPVMNIVIHSNLKKVIQSGLPIKQYFFSGVTEVNPFELSKYASITYPSTTSNFEQLSQLARIRSYYKSKGYLLTGAYLNYYKYQAISKDGVLEYKIIQRHVGNVKIVGNVKTQKYLIDREIQFKKGDPLTARTFVQTYNNLKNTGFFSNVSIYPSITSEDSSSVDVVIKLVENDKPRQLGGALTVGQPKEGEPWYSGIVATGKIGLLNWAGYGQNFKTELNLGTDSNANLSYSTIFPLNLPLNFKSSLYYKTLKPFKEVNDKNIYYKESRTGISASLGYQSDVHTSFNVGGHFELFNRSIDSTPVDFGPASGTSREVNLNFNYVNVDNVFLPMKGVKISLGTQLAGLGGNENYNSYTAMVAGYLPTFENFSIAGRVLMGMSEGKDFQVGGVTTVRGWTPKSGNQEFVTNLSFRYSLPSNIPITLNAFYDWGGAKNDLLYNGNLYYDFVNSVGVGLAVDVPYLGVLRLDFPFKADDGKLEYSGITFGIGQMF